MHRTPAIIVTWFLIISALAIITGQPTSNNLPHIENTSRAQVSESIEITSEQDFENGTLENLNSTSHPGDLLLDKEYFTYTIGQLDSPSATLDGGYTMVPGDSDYVFRSDGVVTSVKISVGDYNAPFKVKILRRSGGSNFYAVDSTMDLYPGKNTVSEFSVNLHAKEGDRLGIYTEGALSAFATTGDNGYWWHFGEVQGDEVAMSWDDTPAVITMQATVRGERYIHYGNWTSPVYELNDIPSRISITWDSTIFDGTSITMYVRTSSDGIVWGDWKKIENGDLVDNPQKYVMLKAQLQGTDSNSPVLHSITISYDYNINGLVINEISSYGTGNSEWVEIYNSGPDMNITGLEIDDQDGNTYTIPSTIGTMPHGTYLVIYFGDGSDDLDFSDGVARVYAGFSGDVLNDNGDDVVLKIDGNPIDYVAFWSYGFGDVDAPPSGLVFDRDGSGYNGYAPAPGENESISLIPNGYDDDKASSWYITPGNSRTPGENNVNLLKISSGDISPSQARQYSTVGIIALHLSAIGNPGSFVTLSSLTLIREGTATDLDIPEAYIYEDTDKDNRYSSNDAMQAQANFNNGTINFTTSLGVSCGSTVTYFIVVKIAENANINTYANFTISAVNVSGRDVYSFSPTTTGNIYIIQRDQDPPYVREVVFNPRPPVTVGMLNITVYFSEDMNTSKPLNVSFGIGGYEHVVSGSWIGDMVWEGSAYITSTTENGELRLIIEDGEDLAGNRMSPNPYVTTFVVDTKAPEVSEISFQGKQPFSIGSYGITISFNEDMDTGINPTVKFGISSYSYVSGTWQDSRTWVGTIKIGSYTENGRNTLYISGARDKAGNNMVENITYIYVDTEAPHVIQVIFNRSQPFGIGEYSIEIYFNEEMNTSVEPEVTFGMTHTYYVNGHWENSKVWLGMFSISRENDNGNNTLLIRNAQDLAGNSMDYYYGWFTVDTKPPEVALVDLGSHEAYKAGRYPIIIVFNEAMDTHHPLNVTYGPRNITVSGMWISNTTWEGTLVITSTTPNGYNTIYISGGQDTAGNVMQPYSDFKFKVDTKKPIVEVSMSPEGPYNGSSTITVKFIFSEDVTSPRILLDGIEKNATPENGSSYSKIYILTLHGYTLTEGEHRIVVRGARDRAGNIMDDYYAPGFYVDKTPPAVHLSYAKVHVEGDTIEIVAHVEDAGNITRVILKYIYSSGKEGEVVMEYLGSGDYIARIKNAEAGILKFQVIVEDNAGNTDVETGTVEIQTFFMAMMWLWITIAILLAAVLGALYIHIRKRRMKGLPALGIAERFRKDIDEDEEFYEE